tara:strand:+ start:3870 stop:4238 length:369 start_codon:yes stop_codon:yes gene_type:complete
MGRSQRVRASAASAAALSKWVLENREMLIANPLDRTAAGRRFERDTGVPATVYLIREVFDTLDVPLVRKRRRSESSPRLDRLIDEVVLLQNQVRELGEVAGITLHLSEGLEALKNRKSQPSD